MTEPLLVVRDLTVTFETRNGPVHALRGVNLQIDAGETLGIVGESGSGKSVTALAIMGLLPRTSVVTGSIRLLGRELVGLRRSEIRSIRGKQIGMVFQDPMTSLNPVITIGDQLAEALRVHNTRLSRRAARARCVELLEMVSIPDAERRLDTYPFQLSGGMRQRVMLAMAMSNEPALLIADEPTTALDVTIQAQVLDVMKRLQDEHDVGVILITHDLGVVAGLVKRLEVMYAGRVVEEGEVLDVFDDSAHPYTRGLLGCLPRLDRPRFELVPIEGSPPSAANVPPGCAFHPRCPMSAEVCSVDPPVLMRHGLTRSACHFADDVRAAPMPGVR
jgi:oligopeptide/dipeptide ABC transporter ATP-binding protein